MECWAKRINGLKPLTIFAKGSILDVWQGSEYAYDSRSFAHENKFSLCRMKTFVDQELEKMA